MRHVTEWNEVGTFEIEVYTNGREVLDVDDDPVAIPDLSGPIHDPDEAYRFTIRFQSAGYRDSGCRYGGPLGVGYAPEGDDVRTLESVHLHIGVGDDEVVWRVDGSLADDIFEHFRDKIERVEL